MKRLILIWVIGLVFNEVFATEYIVPQKPASVDVADIDLDSDLDIVLGHEVSGIGGLVTMFVNNGSGEFTFLDLLTTDAYEYSIQASRINSNEYADVVALGYDENLQCTAFSVIYDYGVNGFNSINKFPLLQQITIWDYIAYDLSNDSYEEIIFSAHIAQCFGILNNNGSGQFSPPTYYNLNYHPTGLACGDLNGNGREDILVSAVYHLDVWFNSDSGLGYTNISDTARAYQVKIDDVDNDGDNDIIGIDWGMPGTPKRLLIYANDGTGNFSLSYTKWISEAMAQIFLSDLNNDSFPDVIYNVSYSYPNSNYELFHTYILFNNQDGTFQDPVNYYTGICSHKSYAADLDGNGWNDIITLNYDFYNPPPDTGTIHILFNDGNGNFVEDPVVGIVENEPPIISGYKLYQNYPNPFNSSTTISYYLEKTANIELAIYNMNGQLIKTITNEQQKGGMHAVRWDGTNNSGKEVSSGVYLCTLRVGNEVITGKMVLVR